jgi:hypothetical protein
VRKETIARVVNHEFRVRDERALNVVVFGIKESSESDEISVKNLFEKAEIANVPIRQVRRLKAGKNTPTSNIILVTLSTQEARTAVLNKFRHLKLDGEHQHVFVREDRTPAEQADYNRERERERGGVTTSFRRKTYSTNPSAMLYTGEQRSLASSMSSSQAPKASTTPPTETSSATF